MRPNKIPRFMDWLKRHPITMMMITLPEGMENKGWVKCSASLEEPQVKLVSTTGIWRKTYVWQSMAKVDLQ